MPASVTKLEKGIFASTEGVHIFYGGTEAQFNALTADNDSIAKSASAIHYNTAGLDFSFSGKIAPTCTEEGKDVYSCNICSLEIGAVAFAKLPHTFVNNICSVCNTNYYLTIETDHPYKYNDKKEWVISKDGSSFVAVTFSEYTYTEGSYDFISIYAGDELVETYSGNSLRRQRIEVPGDTLKIVFESDSSNVYYGFSISKVEFDNEVIGTDPSDIPVEDEIEEIFGDLGFATWGDGYFGCHMTNPSGDPVPEGVAHMYLQMSGLLANYRYSETIENEYGSFEMYGYRLPYEKYMEFIAGSFVNHTDMRAYLTKNDYYDAETGIVKWLTGGYGDACTWQTDEIFYASEDTIYATGKWLYFEYPDSYFENLDENYDYFVSEYDEKILIKDSLILTLKKVDGKWKILEYRDIPYHTIGDKLYDKDEQQEFSRFTINAPDAAVTATDDTDNYTYGYYGIDGKWVLKGDTLSYRITANDKNYISRVLLIDDNGTTVLTGNNDVYIFSPKGAATLKVETTAQCPHKSTSTTAPVAATCTTPGATSAIVCTVCGATVTASTPIPANGHSFGAFTTVKEATTTQEGRQERYCSVCKAVDFITIPKIEKIEVKPTEEIKVSASTGDVVVATKVTAQTLTASLPAGSEIIDLKGNAVTDENKAVGTGMKAVIKDENNNIVDEVIIVVPFDVDGDGKPSSSDARLALRQSVDLENLADFQKAAADVDAKSASNKVTSADARLILRAAVDLEDTDQWYKNNV